ncbi:phosphonate transport system substrate-binding protein [Lachnotalea glycerini]|uniref:Phosphonate transport system substrate-binding protein n=2 Tax=Lachnotalea glycerini TaxID=1763509 RepID=A0A318EUX5_9FIRM|nr:phosphate/phosphite/phosphonate ABC transporter substrate-binding protein [Lachnotalea glycerini]PXV89143.1 phosphonate transport system substrate-binding protein [Lachnotalea glycerini]
MKRIIIAIIIALVCAVALAACGNEAAKETSSKTNFIDTLKVYFVPSREPEEIVTATEPLKASLKEELEKQGYEVGEVEILVGTTFEAVGEALSAGTADIGLIPGGTYVLYDDGADVALTATRFGLNKEFNNPKEWNDGNATENTKEQAVSYRALFIAGPSEKGKELAAIINSGKELTWEDLNSANWSVMSSSSSAGYIYPALWLNEKYGKAITDLSNVVQSDSYGSAFARLASGQVDVIVAYADARIDNAEKWSTEFGRTDSIWTETNVIGVTDPIYNDTVCVSKTSEIMSDELKTAIQKAFIDIANTDEGKKIISIYSHQGYQTAKSSDYDKEREAQKLIKELGAAN